MTSSDSANNPFASNGEAGVAVAASAGAVAPPSRGPLRMLLELFSSIWLGITLLSILFVYCSIGSSGVPIHPNILDPANWVAVRQWRFFEMTEFEWFHWWPFDLLIAIICINLITATLRRVPFNALNAGVWMIHTGIIILALGSVWYFSTKVEGDAPVNRRRVIAFAPGVSEPVSMVALPGNQMIVGDPASNDAYLLQVSDIDPQWELLSGDEKGKKAYKVSVRVQSRGGTFIRDLIADRPQYTQDIIRNPDAKPGAPPMVRAVNVLGKPLVDEALQVSLDYDAQRHFYLMDSRALYLREVGSTEWVQRPIPGPLTRGGGLPRYNDYVRSWDDAWSAPDEPVSPHPIRVEVPPVDPNDPLPNVTLEVSRYLRYAMLESRRRPSLEARLDPTVNVRLRSSTGETQQHQLVAFDRNENNALKGSLLFLWVDTQEKLDQLQTRVDPVIRFSVPETDIVIDETITRTTTMEPNLEFKPIGETGYAYRVESLQALGDLGVSLAIVEIKAPAGNVFKRWVFDDPSKNRDMAMAEGLAQHGGDLPLDAKLQSVYRPGTVPPAPIIVIAGPGENDLGVMVTKVTGPPKFDRVQVGQQIPIAEGVTITVEKYAARTVMETKPMIVPRGQRDRDMREFMSIVGVEIPMGSGTQLAWLPYHHFAFRSPEEVLRRFPFRPQVITMADGKQIELMFSRERMELPAPVVLDDFKVATHIGGFTGQTSSIMDWTSVIRFRDLAVRHIAYSDSSTVSVNKPAVFEGLSFFQAQWDPPDRPRFEGDVPSRGLNYTVLGVGNRNGVNTQLAGCCIAVLGMIYQFYWKPVLKRRRQQRVYAHVAAEHAAHEATNEPEHATVGAAMKVNP